MPPASTGATLPEQDDALGGQQTDHPADAPSDEVPSGEHDATDGAGSDVADKAGKPSAE